MQKTKTLRARQFLSLILTLAVLSSIVFAFDNDTSDNSSTSIGKQLTSIVDFVFDTFGISARLVYENNTPLSNQTLYFYENDTYLSSGSTDTSGKAAVNY